MSPIYQDLTRSGIKVFITNNVNEATRSQILIYLSRKQTKLNMVVHFGKFHWWHLTLRETLTVAMEAIYRFCWQLRDQAFNLIAVGYSWPTSTCMLLIIAVLSACRFILWVFLFWTFALIKPQACNVTFAFEVILSFCWVIGLSMHMSVMHRMLEMHACFLWWILSPSIMIITCCEYHFYGLPSTSLCHYVLIKKQFSYDGQLYLFQHKWKCSLF